MAERKKTDGSLALNAAPRLITIPAAEQPKTRKLLVAAYCRVSSDSRDQLNSFAAQNAHYTALINENPDWELVDIYADRGISGTSTDKRDDFQRLLSDCKRGLIDKVLVKSVPRFARNTQDFLKATRELKALGVGVCFEEQNIDSSMVSGETLASIFAALAQKESESISWNMRMSYKRRMEAGTFTTCKAPSGYRLVDGQLIVEEREAAIIRLIFQRYLSGHSMRDITKEVIAFGIPTRDRQERWQRITIRYILQNERYAGDSLLQKRSTTDTLPQYVEGQVLGVLNRLAADPGLISASVPEDEEPIQIQVLRRKLAELLKEAPVDEYAARRTALDLAVKQLDAIGLEEYETERQRGNRQPQGRGRTTTPA